MKRDSSPGPKARSLIGILLGSKIVMLLLSWLAIRIFATESALARLSQLGELGFVHLSVYLLGNALLFSSVVSQEYRTRAGVTRPDQAVYKVIADWRKADSPAESYAILADDNTLGEFNRATRAYFNFLEYLPLLLAYAMLSGYIFPRLTFLAVLLQVIGRLQYSLGYSRSTQHRMAGFMAANLSLLFLESLLLIISFISIFSFQIL